MVSVTSVKIDGISIHFFNSAIYIFESNSGSTLQLDLVVSEVTVRKHKEFENLIIEIELDNGRNIHSIMHLKILPSKLPQLNLFCELDDWQEYADINRLNENDFSFPNIEEGITLEEIRNVEMPDEEIRLKLKLPINQVEWINKQKKQSLNEIFKEMIDEWWKREN
ncbi:hypothetical protein [Pseudoneobacillus sp. C159]